MLIEEMNKLAKSPYPQDDEEKIVQMALIVEKMSLKDYLKELFQAIKEKSDPFQIQNLKAWTSKSLSYYI